MKRTTTRTAAFFLAALPLLAACNSSDDGPAPAGKGGNATLRISPRHHARVIDSCMVYIKYGAQDLPTAYDDSARVGPDAGEQVAIFSGLHKGNYYLYGEGWDPVIAETVVGGLPVTVATEETQAVSLPVTEDH